MKKTNPKQLFKFLSRRTSTNFKLQAFMILSMISFASYSQTCLWTTPSPSGTINVSGNAQTIVGTNILPGTYSIENFTVAGQYEISTSIGSYLTLSDNANNPIISGPNSLTISIPTPGLYRIHLSQDNFCSITASPRIVALVPLGKALNFDGINDRVEIGSSLNTILSSSNKITVEAWVNPTSISGLDCIIGNYNTSATGMQFLLRKDNSNYAFYVDNGSGFTSVTSAATATAGVWQHVAGSWDGSLLKVYVNGVLSNTATLTGTNIKSSLNTIWLGTNSLSESFDGSIDEARIWNRALCQGEIQNNMIGQLTLPQTSLVAYYQFNQGIAFGSNLTTTLVTALAGPTGTTQNMALTGTTSNWVVPGGVSSTSSVTAFATPTISIAGANSICSGSSTTFTASGVSTYSWASGPTTATFIVTPTVTATYSVVGTATNGCVSNMATKSITVNATPTVAVNSGSICSGNTFTIIPSGASTYTVQGGSTAVTPTANTSYSVIGTSAAGCVSSNTATSSVTVNTLPTVLATTNNTVICTGQTATLTASGAVSYSWNTSATTNFIAVSPSVTTTYTVNGTGANGCSKTTTITQNVSLCTGIASLTNSNASIHVYPNPSNGLFVIELTTASKVTVTNALGQVVFAEIFAVGKHDVNIYSEATGIYFVKVMTNDKQQIIKVIKE